MPAVNTLEVGMGTRGPVPKRDAERRRRNKPTTPTKTGAPGARFPQPRALTGWHPSMTRWYKSLAESGQAQFFEASDWEYARFVASSASTMMNQGTMTAPAFTAILSAMNDLLTTEGARRRASVELTKAKPGESDPRPAPVAVMDDYRQALGG
jgi:hypothetical protein